MTKKENFQKALLEELCKKRENVFAKKDRVKKVEEMPFPLDFIRHTPENIGDDSMECWEKVWCKCSIRIATQEENDSEDSKIRYVDIDVKIVDYSHEKGFTLEILNTPIYLRDRY